MTSPGMAAVQSSNLAAVGYEPSTAELVIAFHSGRVYTYFGVPESVYVGLLSSPSKGEYHAAHIKTVFAYRRDQ